MKQTNKLSLLSAILININIMLGTGVFINVANLTALAGSLGAAVYVLVGILILPLILAFSHLLVIHPGGTFYEFGARLSPVWGFISSWSYFTGKLATSAIGIHVFVTSIQHMSPFFARYSPFGIELVILALFMVFNMFNLKTGRNINYYFIFLKFIPIVFVLCAALSLFNGENFTAESLLWTGIPSGIPLVLFAFAGFEASCSLSKQIENPEKNGPKAIFISYLITLVTVTSYQLGMFGILGSYLGTFGKDFQKVLPAVVMNVFPQNASAQSFFTLLTLSGVAASALGASYGVIYANIWNLYTLAQRKDVFFASVIVRKNKYETPFVAVLVAGCIVLAYLTGLTLLGGNLVPIQQISAFTVNIVYSISVVSFAATCFFTKKANRLLALASIASCLLLGHAAYINALKFGFCSILAYLCVVLLGVTMFYVLQKRNCRA